MPSPNPLASDQLLTLVNVAALFGRHPRSIQRAVKGDPLFPKPVRLGVRGVRWRATEVAAHIANLTPAATTDPGTR